MVWKYRTHSRFSLRVRMKRSATPLPSGWRTKDGEGSMPRVVGAVVVAKLQPRCHVLADGAEVAAHPLPDRFQCLEAVGGLVGVDADAFAVAVVDGDEDVGYALYQGDGLAHVGAPHDVHRPGGDGAVVHSVRPLADPVRRQQPVLPHQAPHPPGRGADAGKAQSRPDLAVALAG